jgi:ABC-2 type transport system ATP-binding protein
LTRRFGDVDVVKGLDLEIKKGTALALLGRNGAGTSTALHCVTAADRQTSGTVELNGVEVDERSPEIRRDMAVVMTSTSFRT